MAEHSLLILRQPTVVPRSHLPGGPGNLRRPSHPRQRERLLPQFQALEQAFAAKRAELTNDPTGVGPEQVLVLETFGSVDEFIRAVQRIPDMEWLGEWDEEDIPPDDDFFRDEKHRDSPLGGQLFLIMTNQQAIEQFLSLWRHYQQQPDAEWGYGRTRWRDLFQQLRNVRFWDAQDRLQGTGILEDWAERVQANEERVRLEAELWWRQGEQERQRSIQILQQLVEAEQGNVLGQTMVAGIEYHGVLAELPIAAVQLILEHPDTHLVRCDQVMFFRPVGQMVAPAPQDEPLPEAASEPTVPRPDGEPIAALLDGLPLENHRLLAGRLIVDDPDGWSADHPANDRHHGTGMASLILHGDLDARETALPRPLYVRPVLKPNPRDLRRPRRELVPENVLLVDLLHRAVRRFFEVEEGGAPAAPTARVINFSIGDPARPFDRMVSAYARLLDWLAWNYKVLFLVSCGNYPEEIVLEVPSTSFGNLAGEEREAAVLKALAAHIGRRRLLAPAEAVNALSIGALHIDASNVPGDAHRYDPFPTAQLFSPVSALGPGYRRAIKPEVLLPGGRQLYQEQFSSTHSNTILSVDNSNRPPGQKVASPGPTTGDLAAMRYTRGTSNATALATRACARMYDVLQALRQTPEGQLLDDRFTAVLLKAMLVHGASWSDGYRLLEAVLKTEANGRQFREHVARFLGYGSVDVDKARFCTDQRATMLGCREIEDGEAHLYIIPLPPSLSGQRVWRRLTLTLAWLTPINPHHRGYRRASLWFEPPGDLLNVDRLEADWRATRRGTVQHEILEGDKATAFTDGDALQVRVNCRAGAGELAQRVPYGLVLSIEVKDDVAIPIYQEIETRIRQAVPITPSGAPLR